MSATSRRLTHTAIRLIGRSPADYAQELERLLQLLAQQVLGGIPAGFNDTDPETIEAGLAADPGAESAGWAAADHVHPISTGAPVGLANSNSEGSSTAMLRADAGIKRDVRVQSAAADIGTRNKLNFNDSQIVVADNAGQDRVDVSLAILLPRMVVDRPTFADSPYLLDADNDDVVLVNATSGAVTIQLPVAATCEGKVFYIKKIDASGNAVTVDPNATETIDGALTAVLGLRWQVLPICSDGVSTWVVIA